MLETNYNILNIFNLQNVIIYLLVINIITFVIMWMDKKKAKYGKWRISETTLFILVLLGGRNWRNCWNVYI